MSSVHDHTIPEPHFLGYHLSATELAEAYTRAGGDLGTKHPIGIPAMELTRTVLFHYLLPGKVQLWWNEHVDNNQIGHIGITFTIGDYNDELGDLDKRLRKRCRIMFRHEPDRFVEVGPTKKDPEGRAYKWWRGEELLGTVYMNDWLASEDEHEDVDLEELLK